MGSWGEGQKPGLRVERKEAGVGGLKWGAQDRRRQGLACVVVKRRRPGSPRGWEGRQTRGGCRETQEAPAPPPSTSSAGSSRKLGWQGLAWGNRRHVEGGPGAQRGGRRKPSHQGECPSVCVLRERGDKDKEMRQRGGREGGSRCRSPDGCALAGSVGEETRCWPGGWWAQ